MSYTILLLSGFKKQAKRLSKKYPSLKDDLSAFFDRLKENPIQGIQVKENCY